MLRRYSPGNIYDGLFHVAIAGAPCRQDVRGAAPTGCRVASVGPFPLSVVPVADGFIVGVNDGVEVCSSAGACTPAPPSAPVSGVAASTAGVLRGTLNAIDKCGPPGVCGSTANVAKVSELQHLAADGTSLYWTTADVATSDGALLRCSLPACTDRLVLASGHGPLHGVALDAKYAYFAARSAGIIYQVAK